MGKILNLIFNETTIYMLNVVSIYLIFIVGLYVFIRFFKEEDMFYENRKKIISLSICIFGLVFTCFDNLYINFIVATTLSLFLFNMIFDLKLKFIFSVYTYLMTMYFFLNYMFNFFITNMLIVNFLCLIIFSVITKVISKRFITIDMLLDLNRNDVIRMVMGYLVVLLVCFISLCSINMNKDFLMLICNFLLTFIIIYMIGINTIKDSILNRNIKTIDVLETSNESLIIQNDKIRTFKHDFNNIIQAMNGYVMSEDLVSLKKYVKIISKDVNDVKEIKVDNNSFLNNSAIVSLLNRMNSKAIQENVEITFEIMYELNLLNKYEYELIRILGIFLDNAIEAEREEEEKKVEVLFVRDKESKYIIIENNCTKEVDIDKIYTKDFTTKEGNTGLGLWEVKNIVENNPNLFLETKVENNSFKHILKVV